MYSAFFSFGPAFSWKLMKIDDHMKMWGYDSFHREIILPYEAYFISFFSSVHTCVVNNEVNFAINKLYSKWQMNKFQLVLLDAWSFETTKVATSIFDYPYSLFCYLPQSCQDRIINWRANLLW